LNYPYKMISVRFVLILFLSLLLCTSLNSQSVNLVVNPSFEDPIDFTKMNYNENWTRCLKNDTPDYIEFTSREDPEFYYSKYIGGLLPYDGESYVGIFCYRTNPLRGIENIREFIQAPLREPLQKDTLYRVSLYIALDPESTTAIDNFDVYLGNEKINLKKEKQMFEIHPRIEFQDESYSSISWMKLESTYKAKGGESQIVLGNFKPDNLLKKKRVHYQSEMRPKWNLHELERASYYYIDLVTVEKSSRKNSSRKDSGNRTEDPLNQSQVPAPVNPSVPIELNQLERNTSIVLNNIFFDFDESVLLPASYTELDRLFAQLLLYPDLHITIEGHTDNMGTYEYNMRLSENRARAVADYLMDKGLEVDRISYQGYGYTRPLSDNRTDAGRRLNRRVGFRINEMIQKQP